MSQYMEIVSTQELINDISSAVETQALNSKQDKLTAGANISIDGNNEISATDTTYSAFTGTDGSSAGTAGLVPAPATTDAGKFLKADGTWATAGGGSSYTAGANIDITSNVISVDGILPDTEYTPITQGWTDGRYYENCQEHEPLPTPTQDANAKTLTIANHEFDDIDCTLRVTGKSAEYMLITFNGIEVTATDWFKTTKTNETITLTIPVASEVIFNFTDTDTNPPSVETVTYTGELRKYYEKHLDEDGNRTALSIGAERTANDTGDNSLAQGHAGKASGSSSASLCSGFATGGYSFAVNGTASGSSSTAIGSGSEATAVYSTAIGYSAKASGESGTAIGYHTLASGKYATALGNYTTANTLAQQVEGKYNILDTNGSTTTQGTYAHIVGNGTGTSSANRSNAYTLDWTGNGWFSGDVYVGSTSGKNKDAGSKKLATEDYVTQQIGNAMSASY